MKPRAASADAGAKGGGSFMRLEVISMLKLSAMCAMGAITLLLFTIIGYSGAPAVAKADFTSSSSRCTSEFSTELLMACAADVNVAMASPPADNTSSAVVDLLLRLDEDDQVDTLSCMLDKCSATTTRPMEVEDPSTELLFAHYSFGVSGITQKNRYFYLEVAFPNNYRTEDTTFEVTMVPHVRGYYYNSSSTAANHLSFVDLLPDHRSQQLTVHCMKDALFCDAQYFLRFGTIDYDQYRIDVLFNASIDHPLPINGRDPQFRKIWGTTEFTDWMLGIKAFFLVLSFAMVIWYNRNLNLLSAREQNMEQGWVVALGVALVLFNDPLYYLEAYTGSNSIKVLSVVFQVTFFQMLLLFWLIALDNMRLQGLEAGTSNATFFVPKFIFIFVFWLVLVFYHGYIKHYSNNDPTWDPLATNENFALLQALAVLLSLVYLGWFFVLCIMSRHEFKAKRARYKYLLLLSLWVVLTSFLGLGAGSFSPTPQSGGAWTSYITLFNVYVFLLQYLYAPSATTLRSAKARNNTHGKDADPEASPALDPVEIADVEPQGVELNMA